MVQYRRNFISGATYFFTQTLQDRSSNYLIRYIDLLRISMQKTRQKLPFSIVAMVVLPEHMHSIWKLPDNDSAYDKRWRLFKSYFSQELIKLDNKCISKNNRGEYNLWQKRYWEHTIRDERDLNIHIDYVHYNPVKHKLVESPRDWPYSSIHKYIRYDILPENWGGKERFPDISFGE